MGSAAADTQRMNQTDWRMWKDAVPHMLRWCSLDRLMRSRDVVAAKWIWWEKVFNEITTCTRIYWIFSLQPLRMLDAWVSHVMSWLIIFCFFLPLPCRSFIRAKRGFCVCGESIAIPKYGYWTSSVLERFVCHWMVFRGINMGFKRTWTQVSRFFSTI